MPASYKCKLITCLWIQHIDKVLTRLDTTNVTVPPLSAIQSTLPWGRFLRDAARGT